MPPELPPEVLAKMKELGLEKEAASFAKYQAPAPPLDRTSEYLNQFITQNPDMNELKEKVRKITISDKPVLIIGETGTGKELIAKALHGNRKGQWIAINCAGFPEALIESELFGHTKGAFTGADKEKAGLLESAKDGTIFLDEIGELPMHMQAKLLRALQEMKIRKVGGSQEIQINCRIVSATHRKVNETALIGQGFRSDFYFRISTFVLKTTPLRERKKDIPLIVKALDRENKIDDVHLFCEGLMNEDMLVGNVRSLQQWVERYYVLGELP
jgi:transcriptional regulator with PAS, ATPase and Fis domain